MLTPIQAKADKLTLDLGMSEREATSYSVGRAILGALDPKEKCFEREVSATIEAKLGRPTRTGNALFVPSKLRPRASGLDTKTNAAGGYMTGERILDLVDALRMQTRCAQLGATFIGGLNYTAMFPVEDTATEAYWVAENSAADVAAVDPTYKCVLGTPKTLQSTTSASRQLLAQASSSVDLERRLRMDITRSHAIAFDAAAINGSGVEGEPIGLLKVPGIGVTSIGTNGGVPTYATVCDMEAAVANADAPDAIGWLSTPDIRKKLRQTYKNGTGSAAVWDLDSILGRPALVSTGVPSDLSKGTANGTLSAIIAGAWSELAMLEWGALEILADPFAGKKRGMVEITSFSLVNVVLPRPSAFNVCIDAALS